ncbi:MAG: tRNA (adenosine(37)-N6)-threonylcarbamoyltransferase complex dimerization subunit type 1 TsaB [Oscillospiraceae bacterium]|jgi:tRNA threonylcarbamoyladenosine biosynthesis protein TsaB|nr:tRNA (adenosine(37)-N6)-threonylcarbamoyltransferase complex dimerization subunit type 1 TsaB [Oscillospiraceae bacterium]
MITLGLDAASVSVSAAVARDGELLGECFARAGRNHSTVLLPMADAALRQAGLTAGDVDRIAVTVGPGSFTGVRIGAAAAKGLGQALGKPCAGVSTLLAAARLLADRIRLICCAMDARCGQVYAALFATDGAQTTRQTPDTALSLAALGQLLADPAYAGQPVLFAGDGAALCLRALPHQPGWALAPDWLRFPRAFGAILAAADTDYVPAAALAAAYLRPSQAERERAERKSAGKNDQ